MSFSRPRINLTKIFMLSESNQIRSGITPETNTREFTQKLISKQAMVISPNCVDHFIWHQTCEFVSTFLSKMIQCDCQHHRGPPNSQHQNSQEISRNHDWHSASCNRQTRLSTFVEVSFSMRRQALRQKKSPRQSLDRPPGNPPLAFPHSEPPL